MVCCPQSLEYFGSLNILSGPRVLFFRPEGSEWKGTSRVSPWIHLTPVTPPLPGGWVGFQVLWVGWGFWTPPPGLSSEPVVSAIHSPAGLGPPPYRLGYPIHRFAFRPTHLSVTFGYHCTTTPPRTQIVPAGFTPASPDPVARMPLRQLFLGRTRPSRPSSSLPTAWGGSCRTSPAPSPSTPRSTSAQAAPGRSSAKRVRGVPILASPRGM